MNLTRAGGASGSVAAARQDLIASQDLVASQALVASQLSQGFRQDEGDGSYS
jgi:hypothetical protein